MLELVGLFLFGLALVLEFANRQRLGSVLQLVAAPLYLSGLALSLSGLDAWDDPYVYLGLALGFALVVAAARALRSLTRSRRSSG